ncbi:MAG TPA: hypothetical protein DDW23_01675 [Planctomycetes bacterium]|nr:hypothetical protein [Planctomycetota bacterium]
MVFLAGVDEAGYGPFVGPLAVGWSVFRVPHQKIDLWEALKVPVAKKALRKDARLRVDDSKKVHSGPLGRKRLERTVAAFRRVMEPSQECLESWVSSPPALKAHFRNRAPWLTNMTVPLCPLADRGRARLDATALDRHLAKSGCSLTGFGARAVPAAELNNLLQTTDSKGEALWKVTVQVLRHMLKKTGDAPLRIELDRHGGRRRYAQKLLNDLGAQAITAHGESSGGSAYTLEFETRDVEIRFGKDADSHHFPTALASLAAKQTRERMMDLLNEWFSGRIPGLRPTKGYAIDGRRWLTDTQDIWDALGVDAAAVKRNR